MKNNLTGFFGVLLLAVSSCSENGGYVQTDDWKVFYFDFDEVDHYHISISENDAWQFSADTLNPENAVKDKLITGNYPEELKDTAFIADLLSLGYTKADVPVERNDSINELFREKAHDPNLGHWMCMPVYRDILVFRKHHEISGIAKICFECEQVTTAGTSANTREFGSFGTYAKLYDLLNDN